ncbi:ficolin-1 [Culex quinquefasciatus]|uniref:Ficolin-1 n=1 Tax=Culex quinquefasciatus TaxID=7176 RepID=B0WLX3_CULQU|nr:ficolin-1 [Culex quinquefasciatus]|eukprot:XP_001849707.1 ficolin-1 [Culex quinquefasciatus]
MKIAVFLFLMITVACGQSDGGAKRVKRSVGYELIETRLENLHITFAGLLGSLINTVNKNQNLTEARFVDFRKSVAETNSKLLERIVKLETLGSTSLQNQKSMEDKIISKVSILANDTKCSRPHFKSHVHNPCESAKSSGVYNLPDLNKKVYCEMTNMGGGWLTVQYRSDSILSFSRSWVAYRNGFGGPDVDNYWLGLDPLHQLTTSGQYELAIEMVDTNSSYKYARYAHFHVADESEQYKLTVHGFSGTLPDKFSLHNNLYFYTHDRDNSERCVKQFPRT